MNAAADSAATRAPATVVPLLRTLALCDLVDSTALIERLGDLRAAVLVRRHDRLVRVLLQAHQGREIDKTDGFLAMFERPIQAVAFALAYQRELKRLGESERIALSARVGIHVGDVITWENSPDDIAKGAKLTEVEGLVKPVAARLMQLALPDQILMSGLVYQLAHRAQGELGDQRLLARWRAHGRYVFKGLPGTLPVFEVGEEGIAPLKVPPWSGKAQREVPFWRRPATIVAEFVLLLALLAIPLRYLLKPTPAIAFADRDWVIVGDLHNLTDDVAFDDALQTAFRIGLEQSRYVNLLSDLKTRETMKLMQRDPDKTPIDREIGSEIAVRDGARALILPTVAEVGGRVRVTAEIIDPHTRTTVYSESADGSGESSVLTSLDKVNRALRMRLGEALATVSSESQPLDRVATKNLDALRAYSLAIHAYNTGAHKDSIDLLEQAVKLDADFALAHIALARALLTTDQTAAAREHIRKAVALRGRLSSRDALYVDAWQATFGEQLPALQKWKALATLYPDFHSASGSYAFFTWQWANRYDEAIAAAKQSAASNNPHRGTSNYLLGVLYLGQERYDEALRNFGLSEQLGAAAHNEFHAYAYAAQRQFDEATQTLARGRSGGVPSGDNLVNITLASFAADKGNLDEAAETLKTAQDRADVPRKAQFALARLAVESLSTHRAEALEGLRELVGSEAATTANAEPDDRVMSYFRILLAAFFAQQLGSSDLSTTNTVIESREVLSGAYPLLNQMAAVVNAGRARARGDHASAIATLKKLIDGSELCLVHRALMDAYDAAGDPVASLEQAEWLANRRGRAYAEYADRMLTPYNVAQTNLALLRAAELSQALGRTQEARALLSRFRNVWPQPVGVFELDARVAKLQKALSS